MPFDNRKALKQAYDLQYSGKALTTLRDVRVGELFCYHTGFLFKDRTRNKAVDKWAKFLWALYELDRVILVQKVFGPPSEQGCYYLFTPRGRKIRQADVTDAKLLASTYRDFDDHSND